MRPRCDPDGFHTYYEGGAPRPCRLGRVTVRSRAGRAVQSLTRSPVAGVCFGEPRHLGQWFGCSKTDTAFSMPSDGGQARRPRRDAPRLQAPWGTSRLMVPPDFLGSQSRSKVMRPGRSMGRPRDRGSCTPPGRATTTFLPLAKARRWAARSKCLGGHSPDSAPALGKIVRNPTRKASWPLLQPILDHPIRRAFEPCPCI